VLGIDDGRAAATQHRSGPTSLRYQYDALDRLVGALGRAETRPGAIDRFTSTFAYSDIHNLLRNAQVRQIIQGGGQGHFPPHSNHDFDYQYNGTAAHQASRIGDMKMTYDANGNLSIQCRAGLGICAGTASVDVTGLPASHDHWSRYEWTEENRLRQVIKGGGDTTRFLYDASGERVVKFGRGSPGVTIGQFFTIQNGHHATKHVFAGTERVASKLIPVAEQVALWQQGGTATGGCVSSGCALMAAGPKTVPLREETYYYHPDHLGSTSWMTDHEGKVHEHVEYFPYGEVWRDSRLDDDPGPEPRTPAYLFTSKEFDPETRLYYFGARYYDPKHAIWTAPDPIMSEYVKGSSNHGVYLPVNLSLYAYAAGNPVALKDANGRDWFKVHGDYVWHKGHVWNGQRGFTHLLRFEIMKENDRGAAIGTLTLYEQKTPILQSQVFSGGKGDAPGQRFDRIPDGTYKIRLDIRGEAGASDVVQQGGGLVLAPFYGIQTIPDPIVRDGVNLHGRVEWGSLRAYLNPDLGEHAPQAYRGNYLHGKERTNDYTHGCICERTEEILHKLYQLDYRSEPKVPVVVTTIREP
jgi:RHS repeat-associated protein